jgi:hypothetical protein
MTSGTTCRRHPPDVSQFFQSLTASHPYPLGGSPGLLVKITSAQRPCLQHHQRHPVSYHVVHLGGQPCSLLRAGLLGQKLLLPLSTLGTLDRRTEVPAPGRDV